MSDRDLFARIPIEVVRRPGALRELGPLARSHGFRRPLLVTDPGIVKAGHVDRALLALQQAGIEAVLYDGARENPTTSQVEHGREVAAEAKVDSIIALGGGSAMDCAKGVNLLLTNGGAIRDYWGVNKPTTPMKPLIAIPTTAGTGSEAQSFALISDAETHQKMACGDRRPPGVGLRPLVAILDAELLATCPASVVAATGMDALTHAVETAASKARNARSLELSRAAWARLSGAFEAMLALSGVPTAGRAATPDSPRAATETRESMLVGAFLAGAAIEESMLGAAHSCANPLTARFDITHGVAVGLMLPAVVRFNAGNGENPYAALERDAESLALRMRRFGKMAGLPAALRELGFEKSALAGLAEMAAGQWTAQFNPQPVDAASLLRVYEAAW